MGNGSEPRFSFGLKMLDSAIRPAIIAFFAANAPAQVAELVDAHGSGPCAARRGGSSPLLGTKIQVRSNPKKTGKPRKSMRLRGFLFWTARCAPVTSSIFMNSGFGGNAMRRHVEPNSELAFLNARTEPKHYLLPDSSFFAHEMSASCALVAGHPQGPACLIHSPMQFGTQSASRPSRNLLDGLSRFCCLSFASNWSRQKMDMPKPVGI